MRNRRRHPRLDIDYPATLHYQGQPFRDCRIHNFSEGGIYLRCAGTRLSELLPDGYFTGNERREAMLELEDRQIQVRIAIVFLRRQGVGVCFLEAGEGKHVFSCLQSLVGPQQHTAPTSRPVSLDQASLAPVIQHLRSGLLAYLKPMLGGFFKQSRQTLLDGAGEPSDTLQESALFFAITTLEQREREITEDYIDAVTDSFDELLGSGKHESDSQPEGSNGLELVEKVEIDHWVIINDIARRLEPEQARSLYRLEVTLSYLTHAAIKDEANPLSPISLLNAMKHALDGYDLHLNCFKLILKVFYSTVLQGIERLYEEMLDGLGQQGLDPATAGRGGARRTELDSEAYRAAPGEPLRHVSTLLDLQHHRNKRQPMPRQSTMEAAQVVESLNTLPLRHGSSLLSQLEQGLASQTEPVVNLGPVIRAAISTGEELVAALQQDSLVPDELKGLLNRLEVPIIQEVVQDPTLLENSNHPVRRLLAVIEALTPYLNSPGGASALRGRSAVSRLLEAVDGGMLIGVDQVTKALEALQGEQLERFHGNRRIAVACCEKEQLHSQAEQAVMDCLRHQLLGKSVSIALDRLFRYGWINLLVQTRVSQGEESPAWKAYLCVIEILMKLFHGKPAVREMSGSRVHDLISIIRKGFREYPVHPQGSRRFAAELQQALLTGGAEEARCFEQRVVIDEVYLAQFHSSGNRGPKRPTAAGEDPASLEQVRSLKIDEWLVVESDNRSSRMLNLAWKSPQSTRYLLVDGDGFKALDAGVDELAERFAGQDYAVLKNSVQPIVERTIDRILDKSYNEIKEESAIDLLTGLMNRRCFERHLRELLADAERNHAEHVLILLDLDQFQVVNDLCGFEGGDKLLQTVSLILLSYLSENGVVARIGDDEFAMLIRNTNLEKGYQLAESQRHAIEEYRYTWSDRLIPVSASLGVVQVDAREQGSSDELLQAALSACHLAKEGGRNCTRIYVASDTAYRDHKEMVQAIPTIQEALTNDRMVLYVQPIVPLRSEEGLNPHYEILLRIMDEKGELQPPQSFIRIAEHYDLMRAVDRWVVERFFRSLIPYGDAMDSRISFSVNLSIKSIADSDFKRFLRKQIAGSPVQPHQLGFEITETALSRDIGGTASFMQEVREMGCSCYLDDFGSGYASFSYLKDFPVNFVKIDGVFVREMMHKPADLAMVISIMEIAHFMGKQVIAEYVSDAAIGQALRDMGVDYAQGYHFGRPRPFVDLLEEIVNEHQRISIG
ncbi:MAG: DUF1631 family protein [Candidatus Thiodiazotropha sp. (ex Epidulcina cf. delphinae)]|nr:DUF1631 family protein [Candidatus Thiodiazotropha sp. (ex Epidulcina cf. delphinae)]